jgi:hypothetical protein
MLGHRLTNIAVILFCASLAGCATSRSELRLGSPEIGSSSPPVTKMRVVLIRSLSDERVFEQAPGDPSIPSLGLEGSDKASADVRARAIGRKRNTFGQALGDVLLEDGQTVVGVIRDNLSAAFKQAGYRVATSSADAGQSPMAVDVRIRQFWAWLRPGFASLTLSTNIATSLAIDGMPGPADVSVHVETHPAFATEDTWIDVVNKALNEYRAQVTAKIANLP